MTNLFVIIILFNDNIVTLLSKYFRPLKKLEKEIYDYIFFKFFIWIQQLETQNFYVIHYYDINFRYYDFRFSEEQILKLWVKYLNINE